MACDILGFLYFAWGPYSHYTVVGPTELVLSFQKLHAALNKKYLNSISKRFWIPPLPQHYVFLGQKKGEGVICCLRVLKLK